MNLGHSLTPDMAPCTTTTILPVQVKYGNDKSTATKNENRCSNSVFQCLTKMKVRIPFFNEGGKRKTKNENGSSNSVFPCRIKTENENGSSNSVFPCRRKTENENGSSNSVFPCRRKTVGTKVHALLRLAFFTRVTRNVCVFFAPFGWRHLHREY